MTVTLILLAEDRFGPMPTRSNEPIVPGQSTHAETEFGVKVERAYDEEAFQLIISQTSTCRARDREDIQLLQHREAETFLILEMHHAKSNGNSAGRMYTQGSTRQPGIYQGEQMVFMY